MTESGEPAASRAVRLIFEYEGDDVRLVAQQWVDVAVPGVDLAPDAPPPGRYVEARTEGDEPLARVPIRAGFETSAEVFPEQLGEPITRVAVDRPSGAFTVVVPASEVADHVAVVEVGRAAPEAPGPEGGSTSPAPGAAEVVEIASFRLEPAGGGERG
ncbi:MAG TPA: hypothetical protein VK894_03425 [Jiangellales bacterium]|nr:hypothetical protein [Jiangellales bacterium]